MNYQIGSKYIFTSAEHNILFYDSFETIICNCNTPSDVKIVMSESSPNKGKTYMSCSNKSSTHKPKTQKMCNFFKFENEIEKDVEQIRSLNISNNRFESMETLIFNLRTCGDEKLIEEEYPMGSHQERSFLKKYSTFSSRKTEEQILNPNNVNMDKCLLDAFSDEMSVEELSTSSKLEKESNHSYVFDYKNYEVDQIFHNIKPSPRNYGNQSTSGNILRHNYLFEETKGNPEYKTLLEKLKQNLTVHFQKYNIKNKDSECIYATIYQQIYEHFDIQFKCCNSPFDAYHTIYNCAIHRIFLLPYQRYRNSNIPKDQQMTEIDIQGNRIHDKGFVFGGNSDLIAIHWEDESTASDSFQLVRREHMVQFLDYHVDWNKQTPNDGFKFLYNSVMKENISTDKTNLIYKDKTMESKRKSKDEMMIDCNYLPCITREQYTKNYSKSFCPAFDTMKQHEPKHVLDHIYHPYFVGHNRKAIAVSKIDIRDFWEKNEYFMFEME